MNNCINYNMESHHLQLDQANTMDCNIMSTEYTPVVESSPNQAKALSAHPAGIGTPATPAKRLPDLELPTPGKTADHGKYLPLLRLILILANI